MQDITAYMTRQLSYRLISTIGNPVNPRLGMFELSYRMLESFARGRLDMLPAPSGHTWHRLQ
eukprot:10440865-Karenia_brevis.AAC.1